MKKYFIVLIAFLWACEKEKVEEEKCSPFIAKVFDYHPAPGQLISRQPKYYQNETKNQLLDRIDSMLVGKENGGIVSLGGFGGYIIFGFDHTVQNIENQRDIRILGNAFYDINLGGGSCEPGVIMVSRDDNMNGLPDDKWYEIAGSKYNDPSTIKNYQITYYKTETDGQIEWKDNQWETGTIEKNIYYTQDYYPGWIEKDSLSFIGTRVADNAVNVGTDDVPFWRLYFIGYGYADNDMNNGDDSAFDIGWAVDENGDSVTLEGVDFVKVYTAINQNMSNLGEVSTEIVGAYDMHIYNQ